MKLEPIKLSHQYKSRKYRFQVGDLEARDWIYFIVGGFYDGEKYIEFHSLTEFVRILYESEKSLNIFFHFGGGYDLLFIIAELLKEGVEILQIIPRGSSILSMRVQGKYKVHTLRDSSALLPFGLKALTENFGVETKKGEWNHKETKGYTKELGEYLKSDCLGLYQVLETFFNSDLVRKVGASTTIASQAQKIMRSYLDEPIHSLNESQNNFCKKACHGGRTEIFKPIGYNLYEYDINSLYPSVMRDHYYPDGKAVNTKIFHKDKLGIYTVKVTVPETEYFPIIPTKQKKDNKLIFPVGRFITTITSAEILYAEKLGYKFEVIEGIYFTKKRKYFTKFINSLYEIRQKAGSNTVDNILAKLIMNSSYGKFLINTDRENLVFDAEMGATHFRNIKLDALRTVELYKIPVKLNSFEHAGIGAFILAYARLRLHEKVKPYEKNLYYTDTDSAFLDCEIHSSKELGEFKFEKKYQRACFLQSKTYIAEADEKIKIAMKGFDKRKLKDFTFNDFKLALQGELSIWVPHDKTISKFRSALQKNTLLMHKKAFAKRILSKYNKRKILNEQTSMPLVLTDF